jgi:5'-deoxynucleotidase YfbR-like HD superfamily hydrolase
MRAVDAEEDEVIIDVESDPRVAGEIRRYHTWKVHHQQSVGEHTWQVMRIMMTIDVGMCNAKLMQYCVLHDVGEMAGDIPWPGKRNSPMLKEAMDAAEQVVRLKMKDRWGQPGLPALSETERTFFKMCECIEMWEFGLQERSMGNRYGTVVATRMLLAASEYMERLSPDVQREAKVYVQRRTEQESETQRAPVSDPAGEEFIVENKVEKRA